MFVEEDTFELKDEAAEALELLEDFALEAALDVSAELVFVALVLVSLAAFDVLSLLSELVPQADNPRAIVVKRISILLFFIYTIIAHMRNKKPPLTTEVFYQYGASNQDRTDECLVHSQVC